MVGTVVNLPKARALSPPFAKKWVDVKPVTLRRRLTIDIGSTVGKFVNMAGYPIA
jgi:hypothetical protein